MALILAVDDEQSGLYFRKLILEHAGHSVVTSTRVDEALELYRTLPVDLVLTDHLLGRRVGTDMAREMKRIKPSVPIVLLSGTANVPAALVHADAFLSKARARRRCLKLSTGGCACTRSRMTRLRRTGRAPARRCSRCLPELSRTLTTRF